jgi:hypothetical protein
MGKCKLSADGTKIVVSNPINDESKGIVKVYQYDSENDQWNQLANTLIGEDNNDLKGNEVDMNADGTRILVGIPLDDGENNQLENIGAAKVYEFTE